MKNEADAHRRHAIRVAGTACLVVMAAYVLSALVVNVVVTHHFLSGADSRLEDQIQDLQLQRFSQQDPSDHDKPDDVDDAPVFVWMVSRSGAISPLTDGSPSLPRVTWLHHPVTLQEGGSLFRFDAATSGDGTLVVGQSLANTANVQNTLLAAEFIFGAILALATFGGATVVGLRASAPSVLIRRRQADFTADASHELRTPISVIEAEVSLTLERPRQREQYEGSLRRIGEESGRLRRIVEDLLWLARADDDAIGRPLGGIADLGLIARTSIERFSALALSRQVVLSVAEVGDGPFLVDAPEEWIDRFAGVLIDNACKFAGQGGRAEITVFSLGQKVGLRVEDSGPGIPSDEREAVFDRFHRANDGVTGTGLGLSIADTVVRATNGTWSIGTSIALGGARMEAVWRRRS